MKRKNATPPTTSQQQHAQKVTHRAAGGQFKPAPHKQQKPQPAELEQDAGSGFNADRSQIQK